MNRSRHLLPPLLAALLGSCTFRWEPAFRERALPGAFDSVAIADPAEALTFARFQRGGARRLLLVHWYQAGALGGTDLSLALGRDVSDPGDALRELGYDALHELARSPAARAQASVPVTDLITPLDLRDEHVAVGTNYPEHAADAGTVKPFLFPKLVAPTAARSAVAAGTGLLDYEVELGFVPLEPLSPGQPAQRVGLLLCNDYTDRETLMRHLDPGDVESGVGFTTGKSFPGYLPVGDLFVVPRDFRAFAAGLELRLYVNGALRQRAKASEMVWDLDAILAETWARRDVRWQHRAREVALPGAFGAIPERTIVLSGTPHGTVFSGINIEQKLSGLRAWLAGGWDRSIPTRVLEAYIRDARAAGVYLQPGDEVTIHVERLGVIRNRVY